MSAEPCPTCGALPVRSAPARTGDPSTSHVAARRITRSDVRRFSAHSRSAQLLQAFAVKPMTDAEATNWVFLGKPKRPSVFEGTRRRCSDLRAAGYLVATSERRKNPGSPDDSVVWEISTAGIRALKRLGETGWA